MRVWLKTDDIPGLAMTRSFGDEVAARVGVTCEPGKFLHIIIIFVNNLFCKEILEMDLSKDDKFIVIASDGVWEFMNNDDVANIVRPFFETKNAEKAAEAVVRESYLRWKREEEGIVDDITCIIVFLDIKLPQQEPSPNILMLEKQSDREIGSIKEVKEEENNSVEGKDDTQQSQIRNKKEDRPTSLDKVTEESCSP